jgi:molecular chaperone GrpE
VAKQRPSDTDPADPAGADQPAAPDSTPRQPPTDAGTPPSPTPRAGDAMPQGVAADRLTAQMAAAGEKAREEATSPHEGLRSELQEAKDCALRLQAELENYRKRAAREVREERRYANLPMMRDLLPVLDNMDRAIEAAEKTHDAASLLEGVKMVARQLEEVLKRHQCVRIQALNEPFDPHLHEAISQQPSDEHPTGTVLRVTQNGFQLHDRVVRPSQVIVSSADKSGEKSREQAEEKESR